MGRSALLPSRLLELRSSISNMHQGYPFLLDCLHNYVKHWEKYTYEPTYRERRYLIAEKEPRCPREIAQIVPRRAREKVLAKAAKATFSSVVVFLCVRLSNGRWFVRLFLGVEMDFLWICLCSRSRTLWTPRLACSTITMSLAQEMYSSNTRSKRSRLALQVPQIPSVPLPQAPSRQPLLANHSHTPKSRDQKVPSNSPSNSASQNSNSQQHNLHWHPLVPRSILPVLSPLVKKD